MVAEGGRYKPMSARNEKRALATRKGTIPFPAYIPVTTFGAKYPLDGLIRPYLPRLAPAVMVSHHYARQMKKHEKLRIPMLVDSGGFASLFSSAKVKRVRGLGVIELKTEQGTENTTPYEVLEFQEEVADVAFTLDFPIPPGTAQKEAYKRLDLTIANAHWALENRRRRDLPLYACVQAWDKESARECAKAFANSGFDGIAIGGLVPRASKIDLVKEIVDSVRAEIANLPLHVFGLGKPETVEALYNMGVDSVDSSTYVKLAAEGRFWGMSSCKIDSPSPTDRLNLALCNLANACNKTLPLSTHPVAFRTLSMK